jgi:N-acyl homoserine lactone hydrolase
MAIKSLQVLFTGLESGIDKGFFTFRVDEGKKIESSFLSYLIKADEGNILVDTGIHPEDAAKIASLTGTKMVVNPEDYLPQRLKSVGLSTEDISIVIMTHLHWDHTGWLSQFKNAQVIVQKAEFKFASAPPPYAGFFYFESRFNRSGTKWTLVEGDYNVMPGLTLIFTPGHTPGCQTVMVDLPQSGPILLAGDSGFLQENFQKELIPYYFGDPRQALYSIKRINKWAEIRKAKIFATHDADYWRQTMLKPPLAYN